MNFAGTEQFDCGQTELWRRITDMDFVSRAVPDIERVEWMDGSSFACRVRPRFSFLTGSLALVFQVVNSFPCERLTVQSRGKGIGAAVLVEAHLHLVPAEPGTELRWTGVIVEREGLLKPVSPSLVQAAAQRVITNFWRKFREILAVDNRKA